jgi:hypothetical protein
LSKALKTAHAREFVLEPARAVNLPNKKNLRTLEKKFLSKGNLPHDMPSADFR